jgi:hypothetical protein
MTTEENMERFVLCEICHKRIDRYNESCTSPDSGQTWTHFVCQIHEWNDTR